MKKKRFLSCILTAALIPALISGCGSTAENIKNIVDSVNISGKIFVQDKEVPIYFGNPEDKDTIHLYFTTEDMSVPYVDMETVKNLLEDVYLNCSAAGSDYSITIKVDDDPDDEIVTLYRENGYTMSLDFDNSSMFFYDYDMFFAPPGQETVLSLLEQGNGTDTSEEMHDFYSKIITPSKQSYNRYGSSLEINASDYHIYFYKEKDNYYIPLQIISDFILAQNYLTLRYNGDALFLSNPMEPTFEMETLYMDVPKAERSPELIDFTYNELCMVMDNLYGLKSSHSIDKFNDFFEDSDLVSGLCSTDPSEEFTAVYEMLYYYLDDLHSFYLGNSHYFGEDFAPPQDVISHSGISNSTFKAQMEKFKEASQHYYPDGIPIYEEIGNTAYITFDSFEDPTDINYYIDAPDENADDTFGIMAYAHSQITRADSPVENVVLDMSQNLGGSSVAACYTIGTFIGTGNVVVENARTKASTTQFYTVDANLDGKQDDKDNLLDYNLYCITSPISFSCGNLVPSVLKSSHEVTILGQTSGGGTCAVLPVSLADGTQFTISGPLSLSHSVNGSRYDIDKGVDPDFPIQKAENFYDRATLTEYINSLF